jgi:hypothetical protein
LANPIRFSVYGFAIHVDGDDELRKKILNDALFSFEYGPNRHLTFELPAYFMADQVPSVIDWREMTAKELEDMQPWHAHPNIAVRAKYSKDRHDWMQRNLDENGRPPKHGYGQLSTAEKNESKEWQEKADLWRKENPEPDIPPYVTHFTNGKQFLTINPTDNFSACLKWKNGKTPKLQTPTRICLMMDGLMHVPYGKDPAFEKQGNDLMRLQEDELLGQTMPMPGIFSQPLPPGT